MTREEFWTGISAIKARWWEDFERDLAGKTSEQRFKSLHDLFAVHAEIVDLLCTDHPTEMGDALALRLMRIDELELQELFDRGLTHEEMHRYLYKGAPDD